MASIEEIRRKQEKLRSGGGSGSTTRQDPQLGDVSSDTGYLGSYAGQVARGFTRGLGDIPAGIGDAIGAVAGENVVSDALQEAGEGIAGVGKNVDVNPEIARSMGGQIAAGLGSLGSFFVPAGAAGAGARALGASAKGARLASTGAATAAGVAAAGEEQIRDREATTGQDLDQETRSETFLAGAPAGALEAIPVTRGLGAAGRLLAGGEEVAGSAARQIASRATIGGIEEAAQESTQNIAQNLVAAEALGYDPEREAFENIQDAATVGGVTGFIANAGLTAAGLGLGRRQRQIQQAQEQQELAQQEEKRLQQAQERRTQELEQLGNIQEATSQQELPLQTGVNPDEAPRASLISTQREIPRQGDIGLVPPEGTAPPRNERVQDDLIQQQLGLQGQDERVETGRPIQGLVSGRNLESPRSMEITDRNEQLNIPGFTPPAESDLEFATTQEPVRGEPRGRVPLRPTDQEPAVPPLAQRRQQRDTIPSERTREPTRGPLPLVNQPEQSQSERQQLQSQIDQLRYEAIQQGGGPKTEAEREFTRIYEQQNLNEIRSQMEVFDPPTTEARQNQYTPEQARDIINTMSEPEIQAALETMPLTFEPQIGDPAAQSRGQRRANYVRNLRRSIEQSAQEEQELSAEEQEAVNAIFNFNQQQQEGTVSAVTPENVLEFQPESGNRKREIEETSGGKFRYVEKSVNTGKTLRVLATGDNERDVRLEAVGRVQAEQGLDTQQTGEDTTEGENVQQEGAQEPQEVSTEEAIATLTPEERQAYRNLSSMVRNRPNSVTPRMSQRLRELEEKAGLAPVTKPGDQIEDDIPLQQDDFLEGVDPDDFDLMYDSDSQAAASRTSALHNANLEAFLDQSVIKNVMYHGSVGGFSTMDPNRAELGLHVGTREAASQVASNVPKQNAATMMPLYVRLTNPLRVDDIGEFDDPNTLIKEVLRAVRREQDTNLSSWTSGHEQKLVQLYNELQGNSNLNVRVRRQVRELLQSAGIDGLVYENDVEDAGNDSYIVFNPNAIKSAIGNIGTYDTSSDNISMLFDPLEGRQGLSKRDLQKADTLAKRMNEMAPGLNIRVIRNWNDLRENEKKGLLAKRDRDGINLKGVRGWINGNEVALMAPNLNSVEEAQRTMFHEVIGHYSMRNMWGDKFDSFLDQVSNNQRFRKQIAATANRYGLDLGDKVQRRKAVEEFIAANAETNQNPGLVRRVVAWLRHQLRKLGFNVQLSDNDLRTYITQAAERLERGFSQEISTKPRASKAEIMLAIKENAPNEAGRQTIENLDRNMKNVDKGRIYNTWQTTVDKTLGKFGRNYMMWYTPFKNLPDLSKFKDLRQITMGKKTAFDKEAKKFADSFRDLSTENKNKIYAYLTNSEADTSSLPQELRGRAKEAKEAVRQLGQRLVDRGLLDEETFRANEGAYLPRKYLQYVINEDSELAGVMGGGSKVSLQNYLKRRKDIPEEVRNLLLGQIYDPSYLVAETVGTIGRDLALLDFLNAIAANSEANWVYPGEIVQVPDLANGGTGMTTMSTTALEQKISDLRSKVQPFDPDGGQVERREELIQQYETILNEAKQRSNNSEVDLRNYSQVPDSPRYGYLRGMHVRNEIFDDLIASTFNFTNGDPGIAEKYLGENGKLTQANRWWKFMKTAGNVPTHVRNAVGNLVLLDMGSPTSIHKLMKYSFDAAINGLKPDSKDRYWEIARRYGITESTYAAQELIRDQKQWQRLARRHAAMEQNDMIGRTFAPFNDHFMDFVNKMGETYQASESVFKTAAIRDYITRWEDTNGRNIESLSDADRQRVELDAVDNAQKWILDYSAVPRSIRYLRNVPIGAPFISFTYLTIPRIIEGFARNPQKMFKYAALPYVMAQAFMLTNDMDEEEYERMMASLPSWTKERHSVYTFPTKDDNGNVQLVDFGYFFPWEPFLNMGTAYSKIVDEERYNEGLQPLMDLGFISGPVPSLITALHTGIDPFTGKEIVNDFDPKSKQLTSTLNYAWRMAAPTWLTDIGVAGHLANLGEVSRPGAVKETPEQALLRGVGLNVYPQDPTFSRSQQLRYLRNQVQQARSRRTTALQNPSLNPSERANLVRDYNEVIRKHQQRLRKFVRESS